MGLTPHSAAKDASLPRRSGLSPIVISKVTALSGPMPTEASNCGKWHFTCRARWSSSSRICPVSCSGGDI